MQRAYLALLQRLKRAGVVPTKHVLDNEVSDSMKDLIRDSCKLELVPPDCHRRNIAEVAIKAFKRHFLSILAGLPDDFPLYLWDLLLPQSEVTLNLLRQSNMTPSVSAYAHLFGPFDYNRSPLKPMGCHVQIHNKPSNRASWDMHSNDGFYLESSMDHYRADKCFDRKTKSGTGQRHCCLPRRPHHQASPHAC